MLENQYVESYEYSRMERKEVRGTLKTIKTNRINRFQDDQTYFSKIMFVDIDIFPSVCFDDAC